MKTRELSNLYTEQAFLKVDIDEEVSMEIPEENQASPGTLGPPNKAIYGLIQAGGCWNNNVCDMMTIGFEQLKADPCVFRKVIDGEIKIVVDVDVDDIVASAIDQAMITDRLTAEFDRSSY